MPLPFEYHPDAIAEATFAFDWYATQGNPTVAARFWEELVHARKAVSENPSTWTPYLSGTRCYLFRKFPYGLVYLVLDDSITGIAVCHLKRRPGYWRSRLS